MEEYFPKTISKKQASDTGMAVVLIFLVIGLFSQNNLFFKIAIPLLIIDMIFPMFFYFFAIIWLGFSHLLGTIVSKIILTIVFTIMVIPIGIFRRLIGKDSLLLTKFNKSSESVMVIRNKIFTLKDIEKPY
jgi:hypothetical protein